MNEDTWEGLDPWERRDHELIRGYSNDAPVRFGECELPAEMNNNEMMASGESNWKDSWICTGWVKRIPTIENNYERMATSLNYASLREWLRFWGKLFFGHRNLRITTRNTTKLLRYSGIKMNGKVEPTMKRIWKILEKSIWLMKNSFLRQTWKRIWE